MRHLLAGLSVAAMLSAAALGCESEGWVAPGSSNYLARSTANGELEIGIANYARTCETFDQMLGCGPFTDWSASFHLSSDFDVGDVSAVAKGTFHQTIPAGAHTGMCTASDGVFDGTVEILEIHASTIRIRLDGTTGISGHLADGEYDVALCNEL